MGRENFEMFVDKGCGGNGNVSREEELSIFFFFIELCHQIARFCNKKGKEFGYTVILTNLLNEMN